MLPVDNFKIPPADIMTLPKMTQFTELFLKKEIYSLSALMKQKQHLQKPTN